MTAQGGWWSWLGDLNCCWMWECFTALNLLKLGQVPGTWTKNIYLSVFFSPRVFTCIDRTVVSGMSGKDVCCCRKCCMWTGFGESSSLSFRHFPRHPPYDTAQLSPAWLQLVLCTKPSGVPAPHPPALPIRIRNLFFLEIKNLASQTTTHEYSHASQTGRVLPASVPSQSPLCQTSRLRHCWCHPHGLSLFIQLTAGAVCAYWPPCLSSDWSELFKAGTVTSCKVGRSRHSGAYSLVRRPGELANGVEKVDRENIPGIWRQLKTIYADFHNLDISNWMLKLPFLYSMCLLYCGSLGEV